MAQSQLLRVGEHDRLLQPTTQRVSSPLRREIVRKHERGDLSARIGPHKLLFKLNQLAPELLCDRREENRLAAGLKLAFVLLFLVLHFEFGALELLVLEISPGLRGIEAK